MNPIGNLITSPLLGKYMYKLGRKNIIMASYILTGISMLVLSPIEFCDKNSVIALSLLSRFLAGIGVSCIVTTITTIFISDYPDEIQSMLSKMEASVGVGLGMGPVLGAVLYYIDLFSAFVGLGGIILVFAPFAWYMLGTFREYEIKEINIKRVSLLIKPVNFYLANYFTSAYAALFFGLFWNAYNVA